MKEQIYRVYELLEIDVRIEDDVLSLFFILFHYFRLSISVINFI